MNLEFLIVSIYGPNRDNPDFYVQLEEWINEVCSEGIVTGGDWNLVLEFLLDCSDYKHYNNTKAKEQVENVITHLDLLDIWRETDPEVRRYAWRRKTPLSKVGQTFFLISDLLAT